MTNPATNASPSPPYTLHGSPSTGLIMGTWGFFIGFAAVSLYGPAAKYFQEQMQLSGVALGMLLAAPQLTGSLFRIPFGAWVDRVGGRAPMLTLLGLSLLGMWGLVFILYAVPEITARHYPLIVFFGFLSGFGVASFSVGIPQVSYWYPQRRQGTALGTYGGLGNLAPGLFTLWARDAYYFQLRKQGASPEASRKIAAAHGQELFPRETVWQAVIAAAEEPRTWGLVALYFTSFGGFLALTVWFPIYWVNLHHMSIPTAGLLGGVGFSLLAAVIRIYGGVLSERFGGERTALLAFGVVLVGALLLTFIVDFRINLLGEILMGLGMGVGNAAVFKMVPKYVPEAVGGASGLVGGLGAFGGFLIPPELGATVDALGKAGYAGGFFAYVVLAVMAIGVCWYFIRLDAKANG